MGFFYPKKNIYRAFIYLTLLSTTCVKIHQITFFTTQLLCNFLAQTLHTFYKSSPSKSKFLKLPLFVLKFIKLLKSFLEPRARIFASLFSFMTHNFSIIFYLNLYLLQTKRAITVQISTLPTACLKINQIPYVIFQATSQFVFKFCIPFHCHDT